MNVKQNPIPIRTTTTTSTSSTSTSTTMGDPSSSADGSTTDAVDGGSMIETTIQMLAVDLRSTFRTYFVNHYDSNVNPCEIVDDIPTSSSTTGSHLRLPPSITNATEADVERTVQLCANQLFLTPSSDPTENIGSTSSSSSSTSSISSIDFDLYGSYNALDIHVRYITMLQQTGIYRNLSLQCKWQLLCTGQRIIIWLTLQSLQRQQQLSNAKQPSDWEWHWYDQLSSNNLSSPEQWIANVQKDVFYTNKGDDDKFRLYITWLVWTLSSATTFREERAAVLYDVAPTPLPVVDRSDQVPVWTSHPIVQSSLQGLVEYWKQNPSKIVASLDNIEYVIQLYLLSCSDTYISCPNQETRINYVLAQQMSYAVMRQIRSHAMLMGNSIRNIDEFIFETSIAHRFFHGICQVSYDHERRRDSKDFALEPLYQRLSIQEDIETGMKFGLYVLKWHSDRKLFGHLVKYGKLCPQELNQLMNNDEAMKPYRWIVSIRQGESFAEADTSPSTPYRRSEGGIVDADTENEPEILLPMQPKSLYSKFENVDINQQLQDEVTRRRIIEAELDALKGAAQISYTNSNEIKLETEIARLRNEKEMDMVKLLEQENETANLREINAKLIEELKNTKESHFVLQEQKESSESKLSAFEAELERKYEVLDLVVGRLQASNYRVASQHLQRLDMKKSELRNIKKVVEQLRLEKLHILSDLTQQRELAQQSELLANELISVAKERDLLEKALNDSREDNLSLQTIIEERAKERQVLDLKREQEKESLKSNVIALEKELRFKQEDLSVLSNQTKTVTNENKALTAKLATIPETLHALEMAADQAKRDAEMEREKAAKLVNDLSSLNATLQGNIQKQHDLELELSDANAKVNDLEDQKKRMEELETKC